MKQLHMPTTKKLYRFMGVSSFVAAIVISLADFLLEFNKEYGVSTSIVESEWVNMPDWRFSLSLYLCVFMIPFYILGFWLLYKALSKNNELFAISIFVLFSYGVIMGSPLIHGIMSINGVIYKYGINNGLGHELLTDLIAGKLTSTILPVFIFHYVITWIIAPIMLFIHIVSGRSIFKRWTAFLNPLVFMIVGFIGLKVLPTVFVYLTPGSINKGNAALFLLVTAKMWHSDQLKEEGNLL